MNGVDFITGQFYFHGKPLSGNAPCWGMSLKSAGNMSFRWNELNSLREKFLRERAEGKQVCAVELIHSHTVYAVDSVSELNDLQGDGIITQNRNLMPVVTVADCMPIFLYEPVNGVFGTLHSGWKGTGIVCDAIVKAEQTFGCDRRNFCVVMGPHIHDCCYRIDEERAQYFRVNFTPDCVKEKDGAFYLSLAQANRHALLELGVCDDNIVCSTECTCCSERFGSFRRQTAGLPPDMSLEEKRQYFTVQAAWVRW
ncbi:MAG: polyphenol oxidase family protein [Treponema sp.]|nr:polyphenol oxidase family protein [Treponema sp.]